LVLVSDFDIRASDFLTPAGENVVGARLKLALDMCAAIH
jgi:hypothetical protein